MLCSSGCQAPDAASGSLVIDPSTQWRTEELMIESGIEFQPTPAMLDALDHGVALELDVITRISKRMGPIARLHTLKTTQYRIRYLPLIENWQLDRIDEDGQVTSESYPRFWLLTEALQTPRLYRSGLARPMLEDGRWQVQIRVQLDRSALPAPMHLPTLLEPEWNLSGPWHTWHYDA
ncbi:MAG: DUF4390 domain-containing protein [Pseudomonadota bacterium]